MERFGDVGGLDGCEFGVVVVEVWGWKFVVYGVFGVVLVWFCLVVLCWGCCLVGFG